MQTEYSEWRDFAIEASREAATLARTMIRAGFTTDMKANGTVVTDVDHAVERLLRDRIGAAYPTHAILGEEFGQTGTVSPDVPLWCLDPVDGTTNLANGLPLWCVSIGVIFGDAAVAGVVNAPMTDDIYAAAQGAGATWNGKPLPRLASGGQIAPEEAYIVCGTSVRRMDLGRLQAKLRILGSAALDLCYVAAGQAKGCQCACTSLYDLAAGLCIAGETGVRNVWLESGEPYRPMAHLLAGGSCDVTLVTAPEGTMAYLLGVLR
ncbi:MAG: inositol monophosphatase [Armatimonadetes bacterium]|nr:inositol monophosphatase [Armatimonadota bacterium]